jgi:hypothetical protein
MLANEAAFWVWTARHAEKSRQHLMDGCGKEEAM